MHGGLGCFRHARNDFHYTVAGSEIYLGETLASVLVLMGVGACFVDVDEETRKTLNSLLTPLPKRNVFSDGTEVPVIHVVEEEGNG